MHNFNAQRRRSMIELFLELVKSLLLSTSDIEYKTAQFVD